MSRKQPCGCEVDSAMSGTVCLDHNIIYCPLHAAAPEMLKTLRDHMVYFGEMGMMESTKTCRALIAKAKGSNG